jgi:hypothetical protein
MHATTGATTAASIDTTAAAATLPTRVLMYLFLSALVGVCVFAAKRTGLGWLQVVDGVVTFMLLVCVDVSLVRLVKTLSTYVRAARATAATAVAAAVAAATTSVGSSASSGYLQVCTLSLAPLCCCSFVRLLCAVHNDGSCLYAPANTRTSAIAAYTSGRLL